MFSKERKRIWIAAVIVILVIGWWGINQANTRYPDFPDRKISSTEQSIQISIPDGAYGTKIGEILTAAGVIASSESFFRAAVADPRSKSIAPGNHLVSLKISGKAALSQLLDPARIQNIIKISEGAWNSEIFAQLVRAQSWPDKTSTAVSKVLLPAGISALEGVLFPAQYSFAEGTTKQMALQKMINKFTQVISALNFVDPQGKLSVQELVTLASLLQAEGDTKDFVKISRVIRNRLAIGMPLQLDSTVHYLKQTRGQIYLSNNSTKLKSPYNTYQNYGLPPAPIGNPGLSALKAAISPASGDWLFFITVAPGDTRFTKSFSEFNNWKSLYKKNLKAGLFG